MSSTARPLPNIEMIDAQMAQILRSKTEAERLAIANGMWRFARNTIRNVLHAEHPEWTEDQINREVAKWIWHGPV